MFFSKFPLIAYTLDNSNSFQVIPDILRRIKMSDQIKNNDVFFDRYDVRDGETPEILADKFYGDSNFHWIILMINDIIDPRFDWPMDFYKLNEYCKGKYGTDAVYHIHHYADQSEYVINGYRMLQPGSTINNPISLVVQSSGTFSSPIVSQNAPTNNLFPVTNFMYEDALNEKRRRISILKPELVAGLDSDFNNLIKQ
jgi:hypothetical protein